MAAAPSNLPAPPRAPGPAWSAGFYLLTRIVVLVAALLAPQDRSKPHFHWWADNPLIRWDSGHYLAIMTRGYPQAAPDGSIYDVAAFFPLYPIVTWPAWQAIRGVDALLGGSAGSRAPEQDWSAHLALVLVSHLAGLIAVIVFHRWCAACTDNRTAFRASALLCSFPAAMYFSTGYAEGVFVLCIALTLWFDRQRRPFAAALACGLATATRPTGIVLAAALFVLNALRWWQLRRAATGPSPEAAALPPRSAAGIGRLLALGALSVSGILAHEAFLWSYYGRPDAYFHAQQTWALPDDAAHHDWVRAVTFAPVLEPAVKPIKYALRGQFRLLLDARNWNRFVNVVMLTIAVCALCRPGAIPGPWFLLTILVFLMAWSEDPFTGGRLLGITRYHLLGLPCFLWLATTRAARHRWPCWGLVCASLALECIYVAGYVDWTLVS